MRVFLWPSRSLFFLIYKPPLIACRQKMIDGKAPKSSSSPYELSRNVALRIAFSALPSLPPSKAKIDGS